MQATRAQAEAEGELAHVKVERDRALQELRVNCEAEGELQQVRSERDRALENLRVNALQEAARESAREQERTTEIERERMRERERELGQKMLLAAQKAQAAAEGELQHLQTERLQPMEALVEQLKSVSIQHQETIRELCKERHALEARLKASEDAAAVLHVKLQTAEEGKAASDATVRHRGMGTLLMGTILRFASVPLRKMGTDLLGSWWPCQCVLPTLTS